MVGTFSELKSGPVGLSRATRWRNIWSFLSGSLAGCVQTFDIAQGNIIRHKTCQLTHTCSAIPRNDFDV